MMIHEEFIHEPRVAYFSMEIALKSDIPTYSGGLGVLAGDTVRTAADLELPLVAVSLVSRAGYFRQEIDAAGRQMEQPECWDPGAYGTRLKATVAVPIEGRDVWVGGWLYLVEGHIGGREPVILLDTDLDVNRPDDREITHYLYGGDAAYRLKQEIVLGIGGVRMLQALGFQVRHHHMNEGHSALLAVELMRRFSRPPAELLPGEFACDLRRVREVCNFTTHTPVEAGHDRFGYDLVLRTLGDWVDIAMLRALAGEDALNMTRLALRLSEYVNGVGMRHAEVSRTLFPGYRVHAVTNGVHPHTWTCPSFARLYDQHVPGWRHEPELLTRADQIPAESLWDAHREAKQALTQLVKARTGVTLDVDLPVIGFARRMTAYKRPDLLFSDLERLSRMAQRSPFQLVFAGKAHPRDEGGKWLIERLHAHMRTVADVIPIAYLPDYRMDTAAAMVSGVDLWLNTPLRPLEASGTSGMKAAFNGVSQLSILDGWWIQGCIEGVTGWGVGSASSAANGNDAEDLYHRLENMVLPLYYGERSGWIAVMRGAISKNASYFNSHRMMRRYITEAYLR
jgi:starch phosphorylase